jgi:hypothetical protein
MDDRGNLTELLIYTSPDGKTRIDVRLQEETVWLSQAQMSELFQTTKQNISLHIKNIFDESELREDSVVKEYLTTAPDGKRYLTKFYNLDVIISVGYRVRSSGHPVPDLGYPAAFESTSSRGSQEFPQISGPSQPSSSSNCRLGDSIAGGLGFGRGCS